MTYSHGEKALGTPSKTFTRSLNRSLEQLEKELAQIEAKLESVVKTTKENRLDQLTSILEMGTKTAMLLIVLTEGFTSFENFRHLCYFIGITPTIRNSGTSVRGHSWIGKVGILKFWNLLFMCSITACRTNKACREIYERIDAKGKK